MKLRNIYLAIKDQFPLSRLWRNLRKGHLFGLMSKRSHENANGNPKVMYNSKATAEKSALAMREKHLKKHGVLVWFSNYKCMRCDGFHIGKNREHKTQL
jgi:hypothetical protein